MRRSANLRLGILAAVIATGAQAQMFTPPAHPFAAPSPWPLGFNGPFNQQSTRYEGPLPGDTLQIDFVGRDARGPLPSGVLYSAPYAAGVFITYGTNSREIWKIVRTPTTLEKADFRVERLWAPGDGLQFTSGYWLPDGETGAYFLIGDEIVHFVDAVPGDPYSKIAERARLSIANAIKDSGRKRRNFALGFVRLYSGALLFTTTDGGVCTVAASLDSRSLRCIDVIPEGTDDRIRNSVAAEPDGGRDLIYLTTSNAVVALGFDGKTGQFAELWRVPVADTGSSPTLMGDRRNGAALIVVSTFPDPPSPEAPYELIAIDRGDGVAAAQRIVDRIAIDFDLPEAQQRLIRPTQNSLPVAGYTTVVANFNGIFTYAEPAAPSATGAQAFVFDTGTRKWVRLWTNRDVYFPNSMLAIGGAGTASPVVYGIGLRGVESAEKPPRRRLRLRQPDGADAPVWTLEALRLGDGASLAQWDIGAGPEWNVNGSGVQIGPDREILTSGSRGVYRLLPVATANGQ